MSRILIVEDDASMSNLYEAILKPRFELRQLNDGKALLSEVESFRPDLIVLDMDLGTYEDGVDLAEKLQSTWETKKTPILFVTAKNTPDDLVRGFQAGAEDYLTKPFQPFELLARCQHRIRKAKNAKEGNPVVTIGTLRMDLITRKCFDGDEAIELSPAEFQILLSLVKNEDKVIERKELCLEALGESRLNSRIIDTHVSAIRRKIPKLKDRIESVYAVGYRLSSPEQTK